MTSDIAIATAGGAPDWALYAAIASSGFFIARFSSLCATGAQRGRILVGVAVGLAIALAVGSVKHQAATHILILFADAMFASAAASFLVDRELKNVFVKRKDGASRADLPPAASAKFAYGIIGIVVVLLIIEYLFLWH